VFFVCFVVKSDFLKVEAKMDLNQICLWICENPAVIAGVLIVIITEVMPFLPTKYNGIAHALIGMLAKIPKGAAKLLLFAVLCTLSAGLTGCQPFTINATNTGCCNGGKVELPRDSATPRENGLEPLSCHGGVVVIVNNSNNKDVPVDVLRGMLQNATLQGNVPLQGGAVNYPTQNVTGK
jgi:hypothetical protein